MDKLKNIYKISPSNYFRILQYKITDTYKLDNRDTMLQINNDWAKFASKLHLNERIGKLVKKKCLYFIQRL